NASPTSGNSYEIETIDAMRGAGYIDACRDQYSSDAACPTTKGGWRPDTAYRSPTGIRATGWQVLPLDSLSDHQAIVADYEF
ncbi:MAG TPA: hypothetical protein VM598_07490, partial [Bdellovibrionota bacterium]|nr:hypothetical protein [Bdellovibrionota bacterium]